MPGQPATKYDPTVAGPGWNDVWPFIAVSVVAIAILPFGWTDAGIMLWVFIALVVATIAMIALALKLRHRTWLTTVSPLMVYLDLAVGRQAGGAAVASGIAPLMLLPVLWFALRGTRAELIASGILTAALFWIPTAFIGPPLYPSSGWSRGAISAAIALLVGPVIQRVVRNLAAAHARERSTRQSLEELLNRWRTLLDHLPDTVVTVVDDHGQAQAVGGSEALTERFRGVIRPRHETELQQLLTAAADGRAEAEFSGGPASRSLHAIAVPLPDVQAADVQALEVPTTRKPAETLLVVQDVTEDRRRARALNRSRERLAFLAEHDPVSGLANRRGFDAALVAQLDRPTDTAVVLVDLDRFKQVNDTLGHAAGDQLINTVADVLRSELRTTDLAARLGGDEFGILLPDADAAIATTVARRLVERIRTRANESDDGNAAVTASVGVASLQVARARGINVVTLADMALYEAKARGRDQFVAVTDIHAELPATARQAARREELQAAVENEALELRLQPIVSVPDGTLVAAEALARMVGSDGQLVLPDEFIPVAERSSLITGVDRLMVRKAVAAATTLRRQGLDLRMHVNISGRSLGDRALEQTIISSLADHDLPGSLLVLEVTETAAVADHDRARAFAQRMANLGCVFALDDFGAGYGTFAALKQLDYAYIKIYGEFVAEAGASAVDRSLLRSIVSLAHDLDASVIAEHVSDQSIIELIHREGVDLAQGFLVGKPIEVSEFADRFRTTV